MVFHDFVPIEILIPYSLAFIVLAIGTYTDLRTREVPDWINIGLIGTGFGVNLLFSIIFWNWSFIVNSLVGFGILFVIAYLMFYSGQWGGGDSKMIMGLGAIIGIDVFSGTFPFLASFMINALLVGAVYGILWSFGLIIKHRKAFSKALSKIMLTQKTKNFRAFVFVLFIIFILVSLIVEKDILRLIFLYLSLISIISFYLWVVVKAVENSCMLKLVCPFKLTEGDWISKDIKISGKYVTGPKDLGISRAQIKKLIVFHKKRMIKKVLIKEGIPFVPSFLIAFIVTLVFGNLAMIFA